MIKKCVKVKLCVLWTMERGESYNLKVIKCVLCATPMAEMTHTALMNSGCCFQFSVLKGT